MAAQWEAHAMGMETAGGAAEEEEEHAAVEESTTTGAAETVQAAANGVVRTSEAGQSIESRTKAIGVSGVGADEACSGC